ncbi:deoxyribodipyrimidine photo-lyase [Flavivirga sp. 57AJ16]|uniref:cryptochrome/photolyase family protein n=1 Tax=Flavivirga sp. 57AJ16 TaxID=3025307 RepID=UPI002367321A|nr:deoxyribodipyrimidine photo-lyase [Flavivirga sp. 57AJ16]MDD7884419.1 deoxyribodipyrimidine photo-lyase [Flavivirga sp. 57AJ16]
MEKSKVSIFWFKRDLRIEDNHGLFKALTGAYPILPIFIFDINILDELETNDPRVLFIYERLSFLNKILKNHSSSLYCKKGKPEDIWKDILKKFDVQDVYYNEDYEPYAKKRDRKIEDILTASGVNFHTFKDQVIFAKGDILKADQTPYTIYTPYKNKWLKKFNNTDIQHFESEINGNYLKRAFSFPALSEIGFTKSKIKVVDYTFDYLKEYEAVRNIPAIDKTSHLSPHLRFGTISIRKVARKGLLNQSFLNEIIWREFFMQILYHFPEVVHSNFKRKYDHIEWRNNEDDFEKWKNGKTGYPMVDAGMRELNTTGYMHNRVRMVTAGFLCKHLLIDWKWGEAYFAKKLLDYELASNNGNWQWAAGTGCDAAPYFRVFNPTEQIKRFDRDLTYVKRWVPELDTMSYPTPMVDHKIARERAIRVYKQGIQLNTTKTKR